MRLLRSIRHIAAIMIILSVAGCAAQGPHLKLDQSIMSSAKYLNGIQYVPLVRICDVYGIDWKWDPYVKTVTLEKRGRIVLMAGSDRMLLNGMEKKLDKEVVLSDGVVFVPVSFVKSGIGCITDISPVQRYTPVQASEPVKVAKNYTINTVIIDPGHGGKDPGAIGGRLRLREKDLTLAISKRLKGILEEQGIKVVMTRSDDVFIPLPRRAEIANQIQADLFVSIHINASRNRSMNGFECYYLSEATDDNARALEAFENASLKLGDAAIAEHSNKLDKALWDMTLSENRRESAALSSHICASVESGSVTRNRGMRTARFYVLKRTRMPAVLVEVGYISNKQEELRLKQPGFISKVTDAIAKGILAYRDEYEKTEGFTN